MQMGQSKVVLQESRVGQFYITQKTFISSSKIRSNLNIVVKKRAVLVCQIVSTKSRTVKY